MAKSGAMQTVARVSIVQWVIGQLRGQIAQGAWPVGHRIPSEGELAESLGVSRPSVREGVRALVHAGLLSAGRLPYLRLGRKHLRFQRAEMRDDLRACHAGVPRIPGDRTSAASSSRTWRLSTRGA